jgi:hypothetical protein
MPRNNRMVKSTPKGKQGRRNREFLPSYPSKIPRLGLGFPDRLLSKVRYHENSAAISTLGGVIGNIYRWNSIFDPDASFGGHQPLYRDIYATIYDHYSVISARAVVKFINTSAAPFIVGCVTEDDTTFSATVDTLCEQDHGVHVFLPPLTGALSTHTFNLDWDCQKILGINPFASETYKTGQGANPAEESDLIVWLASADASTATLYYDITIEYDVLWTELATPTQS